MSWGLPLAWALEERAWAAPHSRLRRAPRDCCRDCRPLGHPLSQALGTRYSPRTTQKALVPLFLEDEGFAAVRGATTCAAISRRRPLAVHPKANRRALTGAARSRLLAGFTGWLGGVAVGSLRRGACSVCAPLWCAGVIPGMSPSWPVSLDCAVILAHARLARQFAALRRFGWNRQLARTAGHARGGNLLLEPLRQASGP